MSDYPDINGAWLSELGKLVYIIIQVEDKFVWHVIHKNGVTETGIGEFTDKENEVTAKWNYNHGEIKSKVKSDAGKVILVNGKAAEIKWEDKDHFKKLT